MATATGTADNHVDLLDKVRTALLALGTPWTSLAYTAGPKRLKSAVVAAGGTGYSVNDVLTVSGGTFTTACQVKVLTLGGGGAVATVSVQTAGSYSVLPSNPVSVTGGGGSSATFTLTFEFIPTTSVPLQLKAPGNGAGSEAYINIDTQSDVGNGYYGWRIYGATGYTASIAFGSQPGAGGPVFFNLSQNTLTYWIYYNTRRCIVIVKTGTNYMSTYFGLAAQNALPSEWPQPIVIAASYPTLDLPSVNNARNSSIADPGNGAAYYLKRSSLVWEALANHNTTGSAILPVSGQRAFVWPTKTGRNTAATAQTNLDEWSATGFHLMKTNALGESIVVQCQIADLVDGTFAGSLEGVFACTGFGRTAEQTLTLGGRTWRLFQRAFRTAAGDFFAIEEV